MTKYHKYSIIEANKNSRIYATTGNGWICQNGHCTKDEILQGESSEIILSFNAPQEEDNYTLSISVDYDGILENEHDSQASLGLEVKGVQELPYTGR